MTRSWERSTSAERGCAHRDPEPARRCAGGGDPVARRHRADDGDAHPALCQFLPRRAALDRRLCRSGLRRPLRRPLSTSLRGDRATQSDMGPGRCANRVDGHHGDLGDPHRPGRVPACARARRRIVDGLRLLRCGARHPELHQPDLRAEDATLFGGHRLRGDPEPGPAASGEARSGLRPDRRAHHHAGAPPLPVADHPRVCPSRRGREPDAGRGQRHQPQAHDRRRLDHRRRARRFRRRVLRSDEPDQPRDRARPRAAGPRGHHRRRGPKRLRSGAGRLHGGHRGEPRAGRSALRLQPGGAVSHHHPRAACAPQRPFRGGARVIGVISYFVFFATVASILAIAVLGLNLQWGNTGLFNGGVVAFFGAGGYATLILGGTQQADHLGGYDLPYLLALAGGAAIAGLLAWVVGVLTLRLRHDYLAIATFGVAVTFESVMRNAEWLAGGAKGVRGFERPFREALGDGFSYNILFLCFVLLVGAAVYVFLERLIRSPFGRLLRAIREDEVAARSLGKFPDRVRLTAFVAGAVIMGVSGGLYATFYAFISPQDVLPVLTFQIWAMLIVGGAGNNRGAILGTFLIWGGWTASGWALSRFAPVDVQLYTGTLQFILIGFIIVGMLMWRPQGLLPERLVVSHSGARNKHQQGRKE